MKCNRCGANLLRGDRCGECGADVRFYKFAAAKSNEFYNSGLEKAKIRNLTAAIADLRQSIYLDKTNIHARNLLGLCLFAEGEIIAGLSEWVISRNIQPTDNIASVYIEEVQGDNNKFNEYAEAIRKYNQALEYARQGNDDMALIQLKSVHQTVPDYVNAANLLGLLYIKKKAYLKAEKVIVRALSVDKGNTEALYLMEELTDLKKEKERLEKNKLNKKTVVEILNAEEEATLDRPPLSGQDVIIPKYPFAEKNRLSSIISIIIGIAVGALVVYFLVVPVKERSMAGGYNEQITDYSTQLSEEKQKNSDLTLQVESLTKEKEDLQKNVASSEVNSTEFINLLLNLYNSNRNADTCYILAKAYENANMTTEARNYYNILIRNYPDSEYIQEAEAYVAGNESGNESGNE